MTKNNTEEYGLVSYLTLRRVVGILGVALPLVVVLWGFSLCQCSQILPSISDYYDLRTRDVFVGILFVFAWFLFTYRGYERQDNIAGDFGCFFALGVALFPTSGAGWEQAVHFVSAAGLFLVLSYFSLFLFTKSKSEEDITPEKRIRNRIYRASGVVILICIALIGLYHWQLKNTAISALKPVFWLESLALWAFGISWLIKGETLFKDSEIRPKEDEADSEGLPIGA